MKKNHRKALSRTFPAYHPKAGESTFFVEKVWTSIADKYQASLKSTEDLNEKNMAQVWDFLISIDKQTIQQPKHHTIRDGHKVKVGDTITFYVWLGTPYRSPQIVIAPPIVVKKVWDFEIANAVYRMGKDGWIAPIDEIAKNDGLSKNDLLEWFEYPKPFSGQIICWDDKIEY